MLAIIFIYDIHIIWVWSIGVKYIMHMLNYIFHEQQSTQIMMNLFFLFSFFPSTVSKSIILFPLMLSAWIVISEKKEMECDCWWHRHEYHRSKKIDWLCKVSQSQFRTLSFPVLKLLTSCLQICSVKKKKNRWSRKPLS